MKRRTRHTWLGALVLVLVGVFASPAGWAVDPAADRHALEDRLEAFAEHLRLGISVASFALYSPTLADLRLHAQQLVNLLEGREGRHYVFSQPTDERPLGLLPETVAWGARFAERSLGVDSRSRLAAAARNLRIYLGLALDAALSSLGQRRLDLAMADMLRVFAYLAAAHETPSDTAHVPGLSTILRIIAIGEPPY